MCHWIVSYDSVHVIQGQIEGRIGLAGQRWHRMPKVPSSIAVPCSSDSCLKCPVCFDLSLAQAQDPSALPK